MYVSLAHNWIVAGPFEETKQEEQDCSSSTIFLEIHGGKAVL